MRTFYMKDTILLERFLQTLTKLYFIDGHTVNPVFPYDMNAPYRFEIY